jgi:hypothetical protein
LRSIEGPRCRELFGGFVFQAAVRALCVVIDPPVFDDLARLTDAGEPVLVEALLPKATVRAFDVRVLDRLARVDEIELDTVVIGPGIKRTTSQFWAVTPSE